MTDARAPLSDLERARCAVVARRLDAAQPLGWLAMACMTVTMIGLAADAWRDSSLAIGLGALVLGLVERYYALRIRFDAGLFADLAAGRIASLAALDAGMAAVGVHGRPARALDDRIAGCRRLWQRHLLVVATLLLVVAVLVLSS